MNPKHGIIYGLIVTRGRRASSSDRFTQRLEFLVVPLRIAYPYQARADAENQPSASPFAHEAEANRGCPMVWLRASLLYVAMPPEAVLF